MINKRRNREIYPGADNRFVICDVCGKKFRVKDTVRIVDRFNLLNNMIVCFADADQTNPQIKPIHIHEDLLLRKDYVRPEATFYTYANTENEDTLPSAPRDLVASQQPFTDYIQLQWNGPADYGNARVLGYRIYRANPINLIFTVINTNTNSEATFYSDHTADINSSYAYMVSIVTTLGESPLSNIAYYPDKIPEISFVVLDQTEDFVVLDQNNYFLILDQNA